MGLPSLIASDTHVSASSTTTGWSTSLTVAVGDVIVVKYTAETSGSAISPSATGLDGFTARIGTWDGVSPVNIWTCVVKTGQAGTYSVDYGASTNATLHSAVIEQWRNAQVPTSTNSSSTSFVTSSARDTLDLPVRPRSIITWASIDRTKSSGSPTYLGDATEELLGTTTGALHHYAYIRQGATGGTVDFGMSAPTAQTGHIGGIELFAAIDTAATISEVGSGWSKTSNSAISTSAAVSLAVGDPVVIAVVFDNADLSTPTWSGASGITVDAWQVVNVSSAQTASGGAAKLSYGAGIVTSASNSVVTVTLTNTATARAILVFKASNCPFIYADAGQAVSTTASALSSIRVVTGDVDFMVIATENNAVPSTPANTTAVGSGVASTGSGAASNVAELGVTFDGSASATVSVSDGAYGRVVIAGAVTASTNATLSTTTGNATAGGGSGALTGTTPNATFTTTTGSAVAAGGTGALTGIRNVTLTTTTGTSAAAGGTGALTGTANATLTTTTGSAASAGGTGALTGTANATLTTTTGTAASAGQSGALTGGATLTTTIGTSAAAGGTGALTGTSAQDATLTTTTGDATAAGGIGAFTATASVALTTTTGDASAGGGTGALTGTADATFSTTLGTAVASGEAGALTAGATLSTTLGSAIAGGGTGAFTGTITTVVYVDSVTVTVTYSPAVGGDATFSTNGGTAAAGGGSQAWTANATFTTTGPGSGSPTVTDITAHADTTYTYTPPQGTTSIQFEVWGRWVDPYGITVYGGYAKGTLAYTGQTITYRNPTEPFDGGERSWVQADGTNLIYADAGLDNFDIQTSGVGWVDTTRLTSTQTITGDTSSPASSHIKFTATGGAMQAVAGGGSGAFTGSQDATLSTTTGSSAAAGGMGALTGTVSATLTTTTGTAASAGGTGALIGAETATFTTTSGDASAAGGIGALTGTVSATLTTTTGDAVANGQAGSLSGDAVFTSTYGEALATGGTGSLTGTVIVDATLTTTTGDAPAGGGIGNFIATGAGVFGTLTGQASAAAGSGALTGGATFSTTEGAASAGGGSGALTGTVSTIVYVDSVVVTVTYRPSATMDGTFSTLPGNAAAAGGTGNFSGTATFGTTTGAASAAGGTGAFLATGAGDFTTTTGIVTAGGGVGSFTGTSSATFTTLTGDASAAGGSGFLVAHVIFTTVTGDAAAGGGTGSLFGQINVVFTTVTGQAVAAGELGRLLGWSPNDGVPVPNPKVRVEASELGVVVESQPGSVAVLTEPVPASPELGVLVQPYAGSVKVETPLLSVIVED